MAPSQAASALRIEGQVSRTAAQELTPAAIAYSPGKLRSAARATLFAVLPLGATLAFDNLHLALAALALMLLLLGLAERLRRIAQGSPCAIIVSAWGVTDARQGLQLRWQDISRILPVNSPSAKALDIELRWPEAFTNHSSRSVRFGAWCQQRLHVPAITLNLWLVDGSAVTVCEAVRRHRPDLLEG